MFWGILFLIVGFAMLLQTIGLIPANLELFWPIVFIALGISILFGGKTVGGCCSWPDKKEKKR